MKAFPFTYSIGFLVLMLSGAVFLCFVLGDNQHAKTQGYQISFSYGCHPEGPERRFYQPYAFNDNAIHNDSVLLNLRQELSTIRQAYDSLHGVKATFAANTPYAYYLGVIEACHQKQPNVFFPWNDHIYACGASRYQLRKDSMDIAETSSHKEPKLIID